MNIIKTDGNDKVLELTLSVLVFQQGDFYVAYCPSLELSSYGETVQDAKEAFDEAMNSYIEDCHANGTLQQDLVQHGWKLNIMNQAHAEPPPMINLDIPSGLLRTQYNETRRVAVC
ncbi:MAG: hypothetical protein EOP56_18075 [Sphingobacteriales bacterium]|nr:MAG: hypothetical protein EOP56_18075 [Sphingobacteriales bacterium]